MKKVIEYAVVRSSTIDDLVIKTTETFRKGEMWKPTGGICVINDPLTGKEYYQAIYRDFVEY